MTLAATLLMSLSLAACIGLVLPRQMDVTTAGTWLSQAPVPFPDRMYCPSWCDPDGVLHASYFCLSPPICCNYSGRFNCCSDQTRKINESIVHDNYNCDIYTATWINKYWKTILGICLPLGMISLIGSMSLCAYLAVRDRRRRRQNHRRNNRTPSLRSRSSTGSQSSGSSGQSTQAQGEGTDDMEGVSNAAYVLGTDRDRPDSDYDDIFTINLNHHLGLPPPYVFQLTPPPYTEDEPPDYSDIYNETDDNTAGGSSYPT